MWRTLYSALKLDVISRAVTAVLKHGDRWKATMLNVLDGRKEARRNFDDIVELLKTFCYGGKLLFKNVLLAQFSVPCSWEQSWCIPFSLSSVNIESLSNILSIELLVPRTVPGTQKAPNGWICWINKYLFRYWRPNSRKIKILNWGMFKIKHIFNLYVCVYV